MAYTQILLQHESVKLCLGQNLTRDVTKLITQNFYLLHTENHSNLTHGDYDPANMLVTQINNQWKISAILDWEFTFAGSYLLDIGMMLRYSHKIPAYFENSFLIGIKSSDTSLPDNWKK